jgi:hypothetical protein
MTRPGYNALTVEMYAQNSTTRIADPHGDLLRAQGITFETFSPGGVFGSASLFIPRDADAGWLFKGGQRLVLRNGLQTVYEGQIVPVGYSTGAGAEQGREIHAAGLWGQLLGRRGWRRPWADNRLSQDMWPYRTGTTGDGSEQCTLDRLNRLRFTPKGVAWANGDFAAVRYTAPTGETIKKIDYNYDFNEGAQAWDLAIHNVGTATDVVNITVTGSASGQSHTFATPTQSVDLRFYSRAAQTPVEDGTIYGQFTAVTIYTETSAINLTEIAKDVRGRLAEINADETAIDSNTFSLVPFVTQGWEWLGDILSRAASFGDASFNEWACYLLESEAAASANGKPVLAVKQRLALTDYDYAVRLDEANLVPPLKVALDYEGVYNWIAVQYRDELDQEAWVTPDDDVALKDATSITDWGQREYVLQGNLTSLAVAKNLARRFLAARKSPKFYVSGPVTVQGYIRAKSGQPIPAANLRAGKRLKIENFLVDESFVAGAGLTFLISRTNYNDADETCSISCGLPDDLAVVVAQLAAFRDTSII